MANSSIRSLVADLPYSMRTSVEGYVDSVADVLPDIEREAGVRLSEEQRDNFLLIVAIRKIWAAVSGQYWIMNDCIRIASRAPSDGASIDPLSGFRLGRDQITASSEAFHEGRRLLERFNILIEKLGITPVVTQSVSLSDVAREIAQS